MDQSHHKQIAHLTLDSLCIRPTDVVAHEFEGELIIVPLAAGIGDMDGDNFVLSETGRAIWDRIDGVRSLRDIAAELAALYHSSGHELERDVLELASDLARLKVLVVR